MYDPDSQFSDMLSPNLIRPPREGQKVMYRFAGEIGFAEEPGEEIVISKHPQKPDRLRLCLPYELVSTHLRKNDFPIHGKSLSLPGKCRNGEVIFQYNDIAVNREQLSKRRNALIRRMSADCRQEEV
jgi:hypothetical protein